MGERKASQLAVGGEVNRVATQPTLLEYALMTLRDEHSRWHMMHDTVSRLGGSVGLRQSRVRDLIVFAVRASLLTSG